MPKKNFFADDYGVRISSGLARPVEVFIDDVYPQQYTPLPIYNPKFYPIEQPAYPVQPIYASPTPEPAPINPKFYYPMPEYPIEQPAYPVQPIYASPTPEPAPINPKFYYPMPEYPIEQPAYPSLPKAGIDFGTPVAYDIPEVPKFDVEPPTLYTPLPVYEPKPIYTPLPKPIDVEPPTLYTPLPVYEPKPIDVESPMPIYSPIDEFIPPVTDVPPFSDDIETGGGVVKSDVEPVKPTTSTETKLPETKPVSKNLTPYVYAGLGIVVILLVARMVTKKD